jgi:Zn-dependent peptidase ImmA (M78 family)/transcriptional regulator with XRE-family HTH domain
MRSGNDDLAYITGSVLEWARTRSGLSRAEVAERVHASVNQVAAWESEASSPPFQTAQELAKLFRIPFGFLFLPKPPQADLPLPDFRTLERNYRPTPDFLELLNDVLVKQDWYREYITDLGEPPPKFVKSFTIDSKVSDVAASIRKNLGISQALRQSVRSWSEYLSALTRNAEDVGVLVMRSSVVGNASRRKVSAREVQGFAASDTRAPLVFVNSDDFKASQIFTLAHELAHIWIGESAISNPDQTEAGRDKIEAFCNRVAAETLVPQEEFLKVWRGDDAEDAIAAIAKWFLVSTLVILRRAHELDRLSTPRFKQLKQQMMANLSKRDSSGGDYYRNVVARMGGRLTYAVLNEVQRRRILFRDASRLLDMKVATLLKFAETAR